MNSLRILLHVNVINVAQVPKCELGQEPQNANCVNQDSSLQISVNVNNALKDNILPLQELQNVSCVDVGMKPMYLEPDVLFVLLERSRKLEVIVKLVLLMNSLIFLVRANVIFAAQVYKLMFLELIVKLVYQANIPMDILPVNSVHRANSLVYLARINVILVRVVMKPMPIVMVVKRVTQDSFRHMQEIVNDVHYMNILQIKALVNV